MGKGFTSQQIARKLNVSTQTIRNWTERYPIEVEVDDDSSKRYYSETALGQLTKINYLKENVHELIRKELLAQTPSYKDLEEDRQRLIGEVRKWKRAQENLLMNNEILLGKKRELEVELQKKNSILTRLLKERDEYEERMKELAEQCEKMHERASDYEKMWGKEQKKGVFTILWERILFSLTKIVYFVKSQQEKKNY